MQMLSQLNYVPMIRGTAMPTIDNMVILAEMFDVTVDEIIAVDMIDVKCG